MVINLWSPKGGNTLQRAYINGLPCLAGGAKAYITVQDGHSPTLVVSDKALYTSVIEALQAAGVCQSGDAPFAGITAEDIKAHAATARRSPSTRGPRPMAYATPRQIEADALDLSSIPVPDPIFLRIDHREPDALFALFADLNHPNIQIERAELPVGDVEIYGQDTRYVIERKGCAPGPARTDFEDSVTGDAKRLFFQSEKMRLEEGIVPIVILEGCAHEHSRGMLIQQIDGMLSYLVTLQKANVFTTYGLNHTAYFILKLAAHDRSGLMTQPALRGKKPRQPIDQVAFVYEGLPGISTGLARDLAMQYPSLAALCNSPESELLAIKGLGPKRLAQLKAILYGSD